MIRRDLLSAGGLMAAALLPQAAQASPPPPQGAQSASWVRTKDGEALFVKDWQGDDARNKPTLVFQAGSGLPSEMWEYVSAPLALKGFRCLSYDRRGHGRSTVPLSGYDYDTLATTSMPCSKHAMSATPCSSATPWAAARWSAT